MTNEGNRGANSVSYRFTGRYSSETSDFVEIQRSISILNPSTYCYETFDIQFPDTGLVCLRVIVDPGNSIVELNRANNQDSVFIRVQAGSPPSTPRLLSPSRDKILEIATPPVPVQFVWSRSVDPDVQDSVAYQLWFRGPFFDTTVVGMKDTMASLNIMSRLNPGTTYQWSVQASDGIFLVSSVDTFMVRAIVKTPVSGISNQGSSLPKDFYLSDNYPNPFNPSTSIQFGIPTDCHVKIELFNMLGQRVMELLDRELEPGMYRINFRAVGVDGNSFSSGIYLCRMQAGNFVSTKKIVFIK